MPWIATGVFVYQSFISIFKRLGVIYNCSIFYGLFNIVCNHFILFSGFLIDKFTSRKIIDLYEHTSTLFHTGVLFYFDNLNIHLLFFLGLIGISNGLANVLGSSTWAELYGVKHI